jgi:hypothetical protein
MIRYKPFVLKRENVYVIQERKFFDFQTPWFVFIYGPDQKVEQTFKYTHSTAHAHYYVFAPPVPLTIV